MDKQIYKTQIKELYDRRDLIDKQVDELRKLYIEKNKPCEIGDMVEVENWIGTKEKGIVIDFTIGPKDDVKPICSKMKKDGTASERKLWIGYDSKIYYPEKATP